jgi:hypothetical protein
LLPPEATETGVWFTTEAGTPEAQEAIASLSISYPLRLSQAPEFHYLTEEEASNGDVPECPGTSDQPQAEPGNLCVYQKGGENLNVPPFAGYTVDLRSGRAASFELSNPEQGGSGFGSWAVTASAP